MTHLRLKDCTDIVPLNDVEIRNLKKLLNVFPDCKNLTFGQFGCAIGCGVLIKIDEEMHDITDYESW